MPTYDRSRYAPRSEVRERTRQTVAAILAEAAPILAGERASDVQRARDLLEERRRQLDLRNQTSARDTVRENVRNAVSSRGTRTPETTASAAGAVSSAPADKPPIEKSGGGSFLDRFGGFLADTLKDTAGRVTSGENFLNIDTRTVDIPIGTKIGEALGNIPVVGGAAREAFDIGAAPATVFTAGQGSEIGAAIRGGAARPALLRRAAANLVEPIGRGSFAQRLGTETAVAVGFQQAGELANKGLEAVGAPAPVRVAGQFAAGIGGAAISAHAFSAAWPRVVRGAAGVNDVADAATDLVQQEAPALLEAASRQINGGAGPMPMAIPAARQISQAPSFQAALDYLEAEGLTEAPSELLRSLHMASVAVENDRPGFLSNLVERVPQLRRLRHADRPGLDMPQNVLEAYVAQGAVQAEFAQRSMVSKFEFVQKATEAFGRDALDGGQSDRVRFIGTAAEAAVTTPEGRPIVRTLLDVAQRPDLYDLTPDQKATLAFGNLRNEELRTLANVGYGTDIKELRGIDGSMHLPQIDIGAEATARAEARGHRSTRGLMADDSQHRLYPTMRERIANDPEFEPELNVRALLGALDGEKARRAADNVYRAGLGGERKAALVAKLNPGLEAKYRDLQHQTQALRGMSARANEAARRAMAVERSAGTIATKEARRESDLLAQQMRIRQFEELQIAASEFSSAELPTAGALRREITSVRKNIEFRQDGTVRRTAANRQALDTLGELQTHLSVREAIDVNKGDLDGALRDLDRLRTDLLRSETTGLASRTYQSTPEIAQAHARALDRFVDTAKVDVRPWQEDPDRLHTLELLGERIKELELRDEAIQANVGAAELSSARLGDRDRFRQTLAAVKLQYDDVKSAYQGQNTRGWMKADAGTGLFRYYPTEAGAAINRLSESHLHPYQRWVAELNATVLSGDTSPITGVQAPLAFLFNPRATVRQIREEGFSSFFSQAAIVDKVRADPEGWADFAFYTGRALPQGTPDEFAGGLLSRLPGGWGGRYSTLNEGAYSAVLQLQKRMWDDAADGLIKSGVDPMLAKAAAGDVVAKAIPMLNTRRLGQSTQQSALQRMPFTSISFIRQPIALMDAAATGYVKMATGQSAKLTPNERLASTMMAKLVGTTTALAATTSALSALQAGDDPVEAALKAIDPRDASFMAITIGDRRVPIGGPFRSLIRAIAPREVETGAGRFDIPFVGLKSFVQNRITPIGGTTRDLIRNKDFYGDEIKTEDGVIGIGQQLLYGFSGAAPISVGEAIRGTVRGESMEDLLLGSAASFGGVNLQEQSAYRGFDKLAQRAYGRGFYELEPWQREVLKEQNPGLWEKRVQQGSQNFQRAEAVRTVLYEKQLSDDRSLVGGEISREDWRDARGKRRDEQRFRLMEIYSDSNRPNADPQNAYERYLELVRQNEVDGKVDWNAVDVAVAQLPADQREDIRKSVGIGQTPLSREYARQLSAYVKLPRYKGYTAAESTLIDDTWQEIINEAGDNKLRRLRAVRKWADQVPENVATALRRRAIGRTLTRDGARDDYRKANPILDVLLKDGMLQPGDQTVLSKYGRETRPAA